MYTLTHVGESIGTTKFERGDPSAFSVSGAFNNIGGSKVIAAWIKSIGGEEDDGVVFIALKEDFTLLDQDGRAIEFAEGHLFAVPEEDEAFVDITSLSEEDYKAHFAAHISAMENDS